MSESQALAPITPKLQLVPGGLTLAAVAPADEANDLDFVKPQAKFIQFNGQDGIYKDRAIESKDPDHHPKALDGLILSTTASQVWFPPRQDGKDQVAFESEKPWGWPKWICRNPNKRSAPSLNPDLTDVQREEAQRRGAGRNCLLCPLAQGKKVNGVFIPPTCKAGVNLLMLESTQEVSVVHFGGTSGRTLERFLGTNFKRGATIRTYAYTVHCGREVASNDDGQNYKVATFKLGEATPEECYDDLSHLRAAYLHQLDQVVEQHVEEEGSPPTPHSNGAPTQPTAAPIHKPSNGLQLDPETGEPILPGSPAPVPPQPPAAPTWPGSPSTPDPLSSYGGFDPNDCPF